jgi:hypothetical protein
LATAPASSAAIAEKAAGNASTRRGSLVFAWAGRQVLETSTRRGTAGAKEERLRSRESEESDTIHLEGVGMGSP